MNGPSLTLFDRAREISFDAVLGSEFKLRGPDRDKRCPCPLCGSGAKSGSPQFSVNLQKGVWTCHRCGKGGDVIALEAELRGGDRWDAARRLAGAAPAIVWTPRPKPQPAPAGPSKTLAIAERLWREAKPISLTLVARYLAARGVADWVIAAAAERLRFHPHAYWGHHEGQPIHAPAMVARVETPSGPTGGVHVTYLARDGSGKAPLIPAKRMWGPQADADGRLGGAWLIGPGGSGPLVVGEGIETVLAAASLRGRGCRALAALSLDRLQGRVLRDDEGVVDLHRPRIDPEHPALTWPEPADAPWRDVLVAVDRDMASVKVKTRTGRGRVVEALLDAEARARLCARLATLAWSQAGYRASAIAPRPNSDFGDEALARSRA